MDDKKKFQLAINFAAKESSHVEKYPTKAMAEKRLVDFGDRGA
jgi:hypothetical protein